MSALRIRRCAIVLATSREKGSYVNTRCAGDKRLQLELNGQSIDSTLRIGNHDKAVFSRIRIAPDAAAHEPMRRVMIDSTGRTRIGRMSLASDLVENVILQHDGLSLCVIRDRGDSIAGKLRIHIAEGV